MNSSTDYWTGYIRRKAEDNGWIAKGQLICPAPKYFGWICTTTQRVEYLHEEIYTALTHPVPKLAFRALVQASSTMARMDCEGEGHFLHDAFRAAQERVETLLGLNN